VLEHHKVSFRVVVLEFVKLPERIEERVLHFFRADTFSQSLIAFAVADRNDLAHRSVFCISLWICAATDLVELIQSLELRVKAFGGGIAPDTSSLSLVENLIVPAVQVLEELLLIPACRLIILTKGSRGTTSERPACDRSLDRELMELRLVALCRRSDQKDKVIDEDVLIDTVVGFWSVDGR